LKTEDKRLFNLILLAILCALFTSWGCEEEVGFANYPPSALTITRSRWAIWTGGTLQLSGLANDLDGDPITYRWTATAGTFNPSNGGGQDVEWTAPETPGTVRITLIVSDEIEESSRSVDVDVGALVPSPLENSLALGDSGYVYILRKTSLLTIPSDVTLTLRPGVTILIDSEFGGFDVSGSLVVQGSSSENVTIGPNSSSYDTGLWSGIVITGEEAVGDLNHLYVYSSEEGIRVSDGGQITLDSCTVSTHFNFGLAIINGSKGVVRGSTIWDNGNGVSIQNSVATIRWSSIRYNSDLGIYMSAVNDTYTISVEECVVANNGENGIYLTGRVAPTIHHNSIFLNGDLVGGYAIELFNYAREDSVRAEHNFWGLAYQDSSSIAGIIYDKHDSPGTIHAYVGFIPWLSDPPVMEQVSR
jgi:parallel beta-helix repeat protein